MRPTRTAADLSHCTGPCGSGDEFHRIAAWAEALPQRVHSLRAQRVGRLLADAALVVTALHRLAAADDADAMALRARLRLALQAMESAVAATPTGTVRRAASRLVAALTPQASGAGSHVVPTATARAGFVRFAALRRAAEACYPELRDGATAAGWRGLRCDPATGAKEEAQ
ncbi:MAG: hypothetical protein HS128_21800 [Ideonella sp.]|nr:hypothetical protein [Ideonella sp.]MCC7457664.1 hypothetical protein [Nitrospira sp.]